MSYTCRHLATFVRVASLLSVVSTWVNAEESQRMLNQQISDTLERVRTQFHLPALAGEILSSDQTLGAAVVGVRKIDLPIPATITDEWHLGSNGKAMTAMLIGYLIDTDKLNFETRVEEIFPELAGNMRPTFRAVTIEQLLRHKSGLPHDPQDWDAYSSMGNPTQQRLAAVTDAGKADLATNPDIGAGYSNWGYVVLGAIAERVTGRPWEELMSKHIFEPLGMTSAGFGGLGTLGKVDQPWPHENGVPSPKNGPANDNPPVGGPAGTIHCSLADWGRFVQCELRGLKGHSAFLKQKTFDRLHTPNPGGEYAGGWLLVQRSWAKGTAYNHRGSNTMNFANVWIAPKLDVAFLVCTNEGDAAKATDAAVVALLHLYQVRPHY